MHKVCIQHKIPHESNNQEEYNNKIRVTNLEKRTECTKESGEICGWDTEVIDLRYNLIQGPQ